MYYTSFGLRGLAILGELQDGVAESAGNFLQSRLAGQTPMVDFVSLLYGAALIEGATGYDLFSQSQKGWRDRVAQEFERLRRDDGGYAKTSEGYASSTYHSFLITLARQVLELAPANCGGLVDFVKSQLRDDGGFVEIRAAQRSGTNPTAAAIGLLRVVDEHLESDETEAVAAGAIRFLAEMQSDEGGLRANSRIPIADLLSTFTGLLTLFDLQAPGEVQLPRAERFVNSLQQEQGGFCAAAWDDATDVEYSFYGLASLALLQHAS